MIPLSLALVLASLGLLVAGLAEDSQSLVWTSLIASLSACGCLVMSVLSRRRLAATGTADLPAGQPIDLGSPSPDPALPAPISPAPPPWAAPPAVPVPPDFADPSESAHHPPAEPAEPADVVVAVPPQRTDADATIGAAPTGSPPVAPPVVPPPVVPPPVEPVQDAPADEPAIEDIPVADALRVAQLSDEVLVVDGRPRYHLADCSHLADRATVPLQVSAARRAGFTPCASCRPDATLLAQSRAAARPPG